MYLEPGIIDYIELQIFLSNTGIKTSIKKERALDRPLFKLMY
jgi:hypothetical protein